MAQVSIFLIITLLITLLVAKTNFATTQAIHLLDYKCGSNTIVFTPNSTYQSNLINLFSSLISNSTSPSGFHNATAANPATSETIYALFLCRRDVTASTCQTCVSNSTSVAMQQCPDKKDVVVYYGECMLRYSNKSFFSVVSESPEKLMWSPKAMNTEPARFSQVLAESMAYVAKAASNAGDRFATKEVNFTGFISLYSLGQCTPDLSSFECNKCLKAAISNLPICCGGRAGGRVLYPSCNVRFETGPFYQLVESSTPVPPPPPPTIVAKGKNDKISSLAIVAIAVPIAIVIFLLGCFFIRRNTRRKKPVALQEQNDSEITFAESLQFNLATLEAVTNGFSDDNKLGGGGFGEVYKGTLPNGQEIAVKRLSKSSGQGILEFKNEVVLVAKLQHRNLVRLLGFCSEGEEKILVYELVENKSLDHFLFDSENRVKLDWLSRYKIIHGIARGILYLHEDSRLKIIHRDLKASNILLDGEMNPKIADFGLARIFGGDQTQGDTIRIVGTYGYMPPEYAMQGHFSVKTDVYSLGVLILEIVTGEKNTSFYLSGEYLMNYAWNHWRNGTPEELLDQALRRSYSANEVIRCIHIALLCLQEDPEKRPTMQNVVLMLSSYSVTMASPQRLAFCLHSAEEMAMPQVSSETPNQHNRNSAASVNEASITDFYPR